MSDPAEPEQPPETEPRDNPNRLSLESAVQLALRGIEYGIRSAQQDGEGPKDLLSAAGYKLPQSPDTGWVLRVVANQMLILDLIDSRPGGAVEIERFSELMRTCARQLMALVGDGNDHLGNRISLDVSNPPVDADAPKDPPTE